jgi:hypothetical protein
MRTLAILLALLVVSLGPVHARAEAPKDERLERRDNGELRSDIERISKEIYIPTRGSSRPAPRDARRSPPARR